jgi:hypothetical protein
MKMAMGCGAAEGPARGSDPAAGRGGARPAARSEGPKAADLARFIGSNTRTALFFCACVGMPLPLAKDCVGMPLCQRPLQTQRAER